MTMYPARYLIVTSLKVVNPAHSSLVLNPSVAHTALLLNFEYGVNQSSTVRNPSKPMLPSFGQDQYQLEPYHRSIDKHRDYYTESADFVVLNSTFLNQLRWCVWSQLCNDVGAPAANLKLTTGRPGAHLPYDSIAPP